MDIPELFCKSPVSGSWYSQIKEKIGHSKRPIDKMSIKEINEMYKKGIFNCDSCGNEFDKTDFTLRDHISHLIDPLYYWVCEDCFQSDLRNNHIIAIEEEKNLTDYQYSGK